MNLLITGAWGEAREYIPAIGEKHEVVFLQNETDALPCDPARIEGIIGNGIFLSHPIEEFTSLRYIQLTSAGFDRVPMDYVREHGITIYNARGVYSVPMAESAVAGVLQLYRGMRKFSDSRRAHVWEKQRDLRELAGRTVAIVGCGSVGNECARRFGAFGTEVVGVDIVTREDALYRGMKGMESLDEVLSSADVVVVTVPLTAETKGLFSKRRIGVMKDGAVLVNISRGAVVDESALTEELKSGRLSAVLDVFENEPLDGDSPLWDLENAVVTPHNSFVGEGNGKRLSGVIMDNLKGYEG